MTHSVILSEAKDPAVSRSQTDEATSRATARSFASLRTTGV